MNVLDKRTLSQERPPVAIHPDELVPAEWVRSRQSIYGGDVIFRHDVEPASEIETAALSHHLIALLLNGGVRQVTRIGGQEFDGSQQRGDVWLLPANQPGFWHWEGTDEAAMFILHPQFLPRLAAETESLNPDRVELLPIVFRHDPQLEAMVQLFLREQQTGGLGGQMYGEAIANLLGVHLLRHYCTTQASFRQSEGGLPAYKLRPVLDYIHTHLPEAITLEQLAQLTGLSTFHFSRQFKQSTGMAPHQFVIAQRCDRAKQILEQAKQIASQPTPGLIAEVATQVGFCDQSHLTQHFKKRYGVTPKQFLSQ